MIKDQSIFIQIAETIKDRILSGDYVADGRIPSVRDIAVEMEVNPNTVMKAFDVLQRGDLIYNKRGMGYFVAPDAFTTIKKARKKRLMDEVLPTILDEMELIGVSLDELVAAFEERKAKR
ncbi:GntR family transcriptional regulator [Porphyromonadaceae bacterium W3.11]|nr:GntR family transcriptional regulator [Porphyromonadaceae bacterium W3.11]